MNNMKPHITIGQTEDDFFLSAERSKSVEHTDRLRSDFFAVTNSGNNQKIMKNEENKR